MEILKNNLYVLNLYRKNAPVYIVVLFLNSILQRVCYVLLLQYSLLTVIDYIQAGSDFIDIMQVILIIFGISIIVTLINNILNEYWTPSVNERITRIYNNKLFHVSETMDIQNFDDEKYYNKYYMVMVTAEERITKTLENVVQLVCNITSVLMLGTMFLMLSKVTLVVIMITFILAVVKNILFSKMEYNLDIKIQKVKRIQNYIGKIFSLPEYVREMKVHNQKTILYQKLDDSSEKIKDIYRQSYKKCMFHKKWIPFIIEFLIGNLLLNYILLYQVLALNTLSVGGFTALYFAAGSINGNLWGVKDTIQQFVQNSFYIRDMRQFLNDNINENDGKLQGDIRGDIIVDHVTFSYKGSNKPAIQNVSLEIPFGKKAAFVGTNGAGKTTMAKLLIHLYSPQVGNISIGNQSIEEFSLNDCRNLFSVLFQDYNVYSLMLAENVVMNQYNDDDKSSIIDAITKTGLDLNQNFLEAERTILSREIDKSGMKCSGGQMQKIAIARILYEDKSYIILDEPSSALDPISEYKFNELVSMYSSNKTVIMISHRLSCTQEADIIFVFNDGQIIERGSHKELMKKDSFYRKMYICQALKYVDKNNLMRRTQDECYIG